VSARLRETRIATLFAPGPRRALRPFEFAIIVGLALAGSIWMTWANSWQLSVNDYGTEALQPLGALLHAHIGLFLRTAPAYGPSLVLRAPFALIASIAHGSQLLIYRFSALPCLLALAALGVWIASRLRAAGRGWCSMLLTIVVCVLNPITYYAMSIGHPEEVLGAVLCVAAVLSALRGRSIWAGVLLGLAVATKEWGIVALGPVLVALPGQRLRTTMIAGTVAGALIAPIVLAAGSVPAGSARVSATDTGTLFYTQQLWWFLGTPGHWIPAMRGQLMPGLRFAPAWLQGRAHTLIAWIGLPLSYLADRRGIARKDALALLALLMALRCGLDPWDVVYYPIPFIVALLSWETLVKERAPVGAAIATVLIYVVFERLPYYLSANQEALSFIVPCVLALAALGFVVYRRGPRAERQSTTSSSFVNWLSRRGSLPVTTVRSSIRTPSASGR
jgi:hypothetical protein